MTEDPRMHLTLSSAKVNQDGDIRESLRRRIAAAKFVYDNALDRSLQLQALARMARLKAALEGLEAS